jgi:hypothetical protein
LPLGRRRGRTRSERERRESRETHGIHDPSHPGDDDRALTVARRETNDGPDDEHRDDDAHEKLASRRRRDRRDEQHRDDARAESEDGFRARRLKEREQEISQREDGARDRERPLLSSLARQLDERSGEQDVRERKRDAEREEHAIVGGAVVRDRLE